MRSLIVPALFALLVPHLVACGGGGGDTFNHPQCSDGGDNDGNGTTDYPNDPGCFARNQDDEMDECPDGATCPQCSDGIDNDGNGSTDYPSDSGGCDSA